MGLVRRQQAELAEREAAIERRDEKIRALEGELSAFRRPVKTPGELSVPPSRGMKLRLTEMRWRHHRQTFATHHSHRRGGWELRSRRRSARPAGSSAIQTSSRGGGV